MLPYWPKFRILPEIWLRNPTEILITSGTKFCPKTPEISKFLILPQNARNLFKNGRKWPKFDFFFDHFFSKNLIKKFLDFFWKFGKELSHKNAIKRGARYFRYFLAKCPKFWKIFLATLTVINYISYWNFLLFLIKINYSWSIRPFLLNTNSQHFLIHHMCR